MECAWIRKQLGPYVDDELSTEARHEVEAHLRNCSPCNEERAALEALAAELAAGGPVAVPAALWASIEQRLTHATQHAAEQTSLTPKLRIFRRPVAAAAIVLLVVGLGLLGMAWFDGAVPTAQAASIDFGLLLDALPLDAQQALRKFLMRYEAEEIPAHQAQQEAPDLNFGLPDRLPGGFHLKSVYRLRFGSAPGIAAEYYGKNGEFLAALFHPPVHREDFGTHQDYPCVIGDHRGHAVAVGPWRLVHVTDPTTCHCVLSKLDPKTELPAVMSAVARRSSSPANPHGHGP